MLEVVGPTGKRDANTCKIWGRAKLRSAASRTDWENLLSYCFFSNAFGQLEIDNAEGLHRCVAAEIVFAKC